METLKLLVQEWTRKSQSDCATDDERSVYEHCAHELFDALKKMEVTE